MPNIGCPNYDSLEEISCLERYHAIGDAGWLIYVVPKVGSARVEVEEMGAGAHHPPLGGFSFPVSMHRWVLACKGTVKGSLSPSF